MSHDPTLHALSEIDPVPPGDVTGQRHAEWALAERERILAVERSPSGDATRRRTVSRRVTGGLVTAGALAGIAALSVAVWVGGEDDAPPAPTGAAPEFGVLDRPRVAGDALPSWARRSASPRVAGMMPATSRLAAEFRGRSLFVTRARGGGVCLVDAIPGASPATVNPGGVNCQPRAALADSFLVNKVSGGNGPRGITAVGVVPDGFTQVTSGTTTAAVADNVFVLSGIRQSDPVVAEGPAGRRVETLDGFGNHLPQASGRLLPVAALETDTPPGSRAQRIGDHLYSISPRPKAGDVAIYRRRVEPDGSLTNDGMMSVRPPSEGAPLSVVAPYMMMGPERTATATVMGLAPDGYDRVTVAGRSEPIRGNLVVVDHVRFTAADGLIEAVATGPAGTLRAPVAAMPAQPRIPLRPSASP